MVGAGSIAITGSANLGASSAADNDENDENMIAIRGSHRAADIYLDQIRCRLTAGIYCALYDFGMRVCELV